ncbi:MAG TPA: hypothetical protein VKD26_15195 [Streptosporangiaceae bacterium]|nr:hypothetical protein [Streptosporangiaceae bacterium]
MSESIRQALAREAAEAEARAEAEERGEVAPAPGQRGRKRAADPSQVYAVRIPMSKLRRLRELAEQRGTQPTALIRQWVIERLEEADTNGHRDEGESDSEAQGHVSPEGLKLGPRRQRVSYEPETRQARLHV